MPTLTVVRELSVATTASLGTILSDLQASAGFVGFAGERASQLEDIPAPSEALGGCVDWRGSGGGRVFGSQQVPIRVPLAERQGDICLTRCSMRHSW